MSNISINDLLFSSKATIELFLPLSYLIENECFDNFAILAEQGLAIDCYLSDNDSILLSEEPFLFAKIQNLAVQGVQFTVIKSVNQPHFYVVQDNRACAVFEKDSLLLEQAEIHEINVFSNRTELSNDFVELIPQKWPNIDLAASKTIIKIGDSTIIRWNAPDYDTIKCIAIRSTDPVGEVVLEPQKSTVLIVDFIIGKRINRKVLAVEVIHEIAIEITVSVKNVLTNEFELLKAIDQQNPVYAIKRSTAVEVSWDVDFADQVLFSPFGKVEKCGTKHFILENPLDLCLSATLGSKTKEKKLLVNCYPTEVDASLINSIDAPSSFYPDLAQSAWSYVLDQKRQSFAVQSRQLEERINLMYQRLLQNKHELRLRLTKMNNHFQNNSKPKLSGESGVGHNKKYDYSSILRRFSKKEG
jgi:hypothetical protein